MDKNPIGLLSNSYAERKGNKEDLMIIIDISSAIQGHRSGTYVTKEDTNISEANSGSACSCDINDGPHTM